MEQPFPETSDPLVQALQRLLSKYGRKRVALAIGANEQSLYQIAFGKPDSKTGRPKSVGRRLRERLDEAFPDWLDGEDQRKGLSTAISPLTPDLATAAAVFLDALRACPHKEELRVLLPLLVETDAPLYRARLLELLGAQPTEALPVESRDFYPPVPGADMRREKA